MLRTGPWKSHQDASSSRGAQKVEQVSRRDPGNHASWEPREVPIKGQKMKILFPDYFNKGSRVQGTE